MVEECQLCLAVADSLRCGGPTGLENSAISRSERFSLLPSVGPLVAGQSLIVSHLHCSSLATMGNDAATEYDEFARSILRDGHGWLEAEHGATDSDCAGACVIHTHVHLLPGMAEFAEIFDGVFDLLYRGRELHLPKPETPYILLRSELSETRVFDATGLPSQMLRQAICGTLGRPDSDWRESPRQHLIQETLEFWKHRHE